jgi:hypothetical protein
MSTRGIPAPTFVPDDPGPWSDVLEVMQRRAVSPGHRRAEPPNGLMLTPPPRTGLVLVGLDPEVSMAGIAPSRVVAAARHPALHIGIEPDGITISGVSRMVRRTWALPGLTMVTETRPDADPAADLPAPTPLESLGEDDLPDSAIVAPGGTHAAVMVAEPRPNGIAIGIAIVRVGDRGLVRYLRGARSAAWTPDGATFVIGGDWGLLALGLPAGVPAGT